MVIINLLLIRHDNRVRGSGGWKYFHLQSWLIKKGKVGEMGQTGKHFKCLTSLSSS